MKLKTLKPVKDGAGVWHEVGSVLDWPENTAAELMMNGTAVPVAESEHEMQEEKQPEKKKQTKKGK